MTSSNSAREPKAEGVEQPQNATRGATGEVVVRPDSASNPRADSQSSDGKKYRWIPGPTHDCDVSGCDSVSHNPDDGSGQRLEVTEDPKSEDPSPESGCGVCRVVLWDPGDGYTRFRESQHHHHALLRAEKERADRLARAEALTATALAKVGAERDAARREAEELRGALKGVVRAAHHRRYHRREHEDCESCKAIAEARMALEVNGGA